MSLETTETLLYDQRPTQTKSCSIHVDSTETIATIYMGKNKQTLWKDPGRVKPMFLPDNPTSYPTVGRWKDRVGFEKLVNISKTFGQHPYPEWNTYTHTDTTYYSIGAPGNAYFTGLPPSMLPLKLALAIKKKTVNLGESIAEIGQTADQLRNAALYIVNAVRRIRRGRMPKGLRKHNERHAWFAKYRRMSRKERRALTLDSIPAAWLGARFGVGPVIHDAFQTYLALQDKCRGKIYEKVYAKDIRTREINDTGTYHQLTTGFYTVEQRANVWIVLDPETPIDFGNPLELAWELIPGSMIADWIFNVGDVLSALDALTHVETFVGTVTEKSKGKVSRGARTQYWLPVESATTEVETFRRDVIDIRYCNYSIWDSLRYQPSTNLLNMVDGLAILRQMAR